MSALASDEKSTTVADEAKSSAMHSLQHTWTLWYDPPQDPKEWKDLTVEVLSFKTVEDFWRLVNNIRPPTRLREGSNYHLFKEGIRPCWEDKSNEKGGKWSIFIPENMNAYWLYTMLGLIGETLDSNNQICGAVVSSRKHKSKLTLWTRDFTSEESAKKIGQNLRKLLELPLATKLDYTPHDSKHKASGKYSA